MDVFTLTLHPNEERRGLATAREADIRIGLLQRAAEALADADRRALLALPAGYLCVPSATERDLVAEACLGISRRSGLGLVFGVDVAPDDDWPPIATPAESFGYVCDGGRRLLWPARRMPITRARAQDRLENRCVAVCGSRIGVVISGEVFSPTLRDDLGNRKPELAVVLAHGGVNGRWRGAVDALAQLVPVVLVGRMVGKNAPPWIAPPSGWSCEPLVRGPGLTIQRYRQTDCAATSRA